MLLHRIYVQELKLIAAYAEKHSPAVGADASKMIA